MISRSKNLRIVEVDTWQISFSFLTLLQKQAVKIIEQKFQLKLKVGRIMRRRIAASNVTSWPINSELITTYTFDMLLSCTLGLPLNIIVIFLSFKSEKLTGTYKYFLGNLALWDVAYCVAITIPLSSLLLHIHNDIGQWLHWLAVSWPLQPTQLDLEWLWHCHSSLSIGSSILMFPLHEKLSLSVASKTYCIVSPCLVPAFYFIFV